MPDAPTNPSTPPRAKPSPNLRQFWREQLGVAAPWSIELRTAPVEARASAAHELEEFGYRSLWIPGMEGPGTFDDADLLLASTRRTTVVIGVQNIWRQEADVLAAQAARVAKQYPDRLLTGLGVGGAQLAQALGQPFTSAVGEMGAYLDALERTSEPLMKGFRLLGSLGPRMARLAGTRSVGLHPFLVPPEANHDYRNNIGHDALLAPHLAVVVDDDPSPDRSRAAA